MQTDTPPSRFGWCLATVFWLLLSASPCSAHPLPDVILPPDNTRLLDHAEFIFSNQDRPPRQAGLSVALPDSWRRRIPGFSGFAWYRLHFCLNNIPRQPLALYVPHLSVAGEVWLNGSLLNPGVRFNRGRGIDVIPMNDAPLYLVLPSGLFHIGDNQLFIKIQGDRAQRSGLSVIHLGSAIPLYTQWFNRYLAQDVARYAIFFLISGSLCFLVAYTWRQRRLLIIKFALLFCLIILLFYLADLTVALGTQEALRMMSATLLNWVLCLAGYRLSGARLPWFEPVLHGLTMLTLTVSALIMLFGVPTDQIWLLTWPHVLLRLVPIGLLLHLGWRQHSLKYTALSLTALLWTITVCQSYLIIMDELPWDSFRWNFAGALPFCIVLAYFFVERFIIDRKLSQLEMQDAILAERARILQDMHDGMGAQLITALRLARSKDYCREELARHIEESLQDLRLIIDSLDLTEHDLLPLLGNLRFRLQPRLQSLGITLEWDVIPIPPLPYLTPASALSILRIVQEAINNALQHAQPTHIHIGVRPDDSGVTIRITDDGHGILPGTIRPSSRGLSGMHARAEKLGLRLTIQGGPGGTEVALFIPHQP
ncbi:ATP-binding protein [Acerihabitans sp. TG2]|uniref:sensor histidine kinase n=1 Tax=Acerihabitans sp. TG2 TaxID=3096008 RepID=UPI002B234440|nr:ATP-binding protein [Acerihabitans sp. TG2]MEA9392026.1 ATP-binding protein [Acerihabitans sp. TG2]